MSEYLVSIEASVGYFFPKVVKSSEVYEAETALEAKKKCEAEFKGELAKHGIDAHEEDINFCITDIKKI